MNEKAADSQDRNSITGLFYGVIAFIAWGFLPIYWKLLKEIPSDEILAHRIFWSFIFAGGVLLYKNGIEALKETLKDRKNVRNALLCSFFITINWGIYILAVNSGNILQSSMGYILFKLISGQSALYSISLSTLVILLFSGVATATPLLWYAMGATRVKLSTMGFLQYISPTISLILGVFVYGEKFTKTHLLSFSFIWIGLIIYSFSNIESIRRLSGSRQEAAEAKES